MFKKLINLVLLAVVLVTPLVGCAGGGASDSTFRLAAQMPMTGDLAYDGQGMAKVLQFVVDEQNKQGGFLGKKIELIIEDDKGDPKEAALVADRIKAKKPHAVIGSYSSSVTEAIQPIYAEAGIVHIAGTSSANRLTTRGYQTFIRTCWSDDLQSAFFAKWLKQFYFGKKIAAIHDNSAAPKGIVEATQKFYGQLGGSLMAVEVINPQDKDFTPVLTKLKGMNPDVVFTPVYYAQMGLLLKQSKDLGATWQWMVGDEYGPDVVKIAGPANVKGVVILTAPIPTDLPYPEAKAFNEKYKAKFGDYPDFIVWPLEADAFYVLKAGVEGAKSFDGKKVADWIKANYKNYKGAAGPIDGWDQNGERIGASFQMYTTDAQGSMVALPPDKQLK